MENKKQELSQIFNILKKQKIDYVFLRGHEFFFNKNNYGEIDILIKKEDLNKLKKIFRKINNSCQFKNNIDLTHPFLVRVVRDDFIIDLDFQINGVGYCGSAILKESYLFRHSEKEKSYNVLDNEGRFLMLFVHGFIFKKRLKYFNKYGKEFSELWEKVDKRIVSEELTYMLNKKTSRKILDLIEKKDLKKLFDLRKKLVSIHLLKNPLEFPKVLTSKLMRLRNYFHLDRFLYFINPFKWAPLVCFIGADGSGKSTMVKESVGYLEKFKIRNASISGGVFTGIKNPLKKNKGPKNYSEKVSKPNESNLKLLARIILQIPKQIKIAYYRKKGIFVVSDRYTYDLVLFYGAKGFFKFLTKLISQKPTKCFYLDVSSEEIHKRNKELNLDALRNIHKRIRSNESYLRLTELKNEKINESKERLYSELEKIMKNV